MLCNFKSQLYPLFLGCTINALLHYAATVFVAGYFYTLSYHSIIYELIVLWLPCEQNLLDNVISVDIFSQFLDFVLHE
jgi:hypothetical protein